MGVPLRQRRVVRTGFRRCQRRAGRRSIACKRCASAVTPVMMQHDSTVSDATPHERLPTSMDAWVELSAGDGLDQESEDDRAAFAASALLSRITAGLQKHVASEDDAIDTQWNAYITGLSLEDRGAIAAANFLARLRRKIHVGVTEEHSAFSSLEDTLLASRRRRVRFDVSSKVIHYVTPYSEIYGLHPREFVFGRNFCMVPAAPGGFVGLQPERHDGDAEEDYDDEMDSSDDECYF